MIMYLFMVFDNMNFFLMKREDERDFFYFILE
jgi:hypothetical protein